MMELHQMMEFHNMMELHHMMEFHNSIEFHHIMEFHHMMEFHHFTFIISVSSNNILIQDELALATSCGQHHLPYPDDDQH